MRKHLRKVTKDDLEILFKWRNHPLTRNNSFTKEELLFADHVKWLKSILKSHYFIAYIMEIDSYPIGVVRFDIEEGESAKINFLIDPTQQGKGYGTTILDLGVKKVFNENSGLNKVYGYILKENLASIKIFEKLSFKKVLENSVELKFEKFRE